MLIRNALSILLSVPLSGCFQGLVVTKPVGVTVDLPPNLRQCDSGDTTDPATMISVGDLLIGYGIERTGRAAEKACHREAVRLIDVHNAAMTSGRLAAK